MSSIQHSTSSGQLDGPKKTSKRLSDQSLERASKSRRIGPSPSWAHSRSPSGSASSTTSYNTALSSVASLRTSYGTAHTSSLSTGQIESLSEPSDVVAATSDRIRTSGKRKSTTDESDEGPKKRSKDSSSSDDLYIYVFSSYPLTGRCENPPSTTNVTPAAEARTDGEKRTDTTDVPRKRSRKTNHPSEDPGAGTSSSANTVPHDSLAAFKAKYEEEEDLLGSGGYGTVHVGYRKDDNLPVAIKHIPQFGITRTAVFMDGKYERIPLEVTLLQKAAGVSGITNLLDWYDLDYEVILVLERPVPCMDLRKYLNSEEHPLPEYKTKIITKQLVEIAIEIQSRGVFHRDLKLDNILIDYSSEALRVWLIDFGCGTFMSSRHYIESQGTYLFSSPEWFQTGCYTAEPCTVWQLGMVVYGLLHKMFPFKDSTEIIQKDPVVSDSLTPDCEGFLLSCLNKTPGARPNLKTLRDHPWLM